MQFFQVRFNWEMSTDDGKLKKVNEVHLIQAKTCSQAQRITKQLYESTSPGFNIIEIKVSKIKDVFIQKEKN